MGLEQPFEENDPRGQQNDQQPPVDGHRQRVEEALAPSVPTNAPWTEKTTKRIIAIRAAQRMDRLNRLTCRP